MFLSLGPELILFHSRWSSKCAPASLVECVRARCSGREFVRAAWWTVAVRALCLADDLSAPGRRSLTPLTETGVACVRTTTPDWRTELLLWSAIYYRYDEQGRLSKVSLGGVLTRQYGYDYNGNRTSVDVAGDIIATYDNQDRMLTYNTMSYGYGPNGERSTRTNADGSVDQYQYDAVGNLVHITRADSVTIDYVVDAFNRRIAKNKNGAAYAQYIYRNGLSPVAVLTSSGALAARFVYASRPNTPDFMVLASGTVYKFINDQRGSPHAIVNATTGALAKLMTYDEFGNQTVMLDTGVIPAWMQPFGFAGGLYDEDTGLTRFGARDYEAATGRWLAKDPILFGGGQANLYVYAGSDPVNRVDPMGTWGFALGDGGDAGFCFGLCAGSWSGVGGVYVGTEGFGVYASEQGGVGLGGHLGYGVQGSFFSSLDAFEGISAGVEGVVGFGAITTGSVVATNRGWVGSLGGGAGGGFYAGAVVSKTEIYGLRWRELKEAWDFAFPAARVCPP